MEFYDNPFERDYEPTDEEISWALYVADVLDDQAEHRRGTVVHV